MFLSIYFAYQKSQWLVMFVIKNHDNSSNIKITQNFYHSISVITFKDPMGPTGDFFPYCCNHLNFTQLTGKAGILCLLPYLFFTE